MKKRLLQTGSLMMALYVLFLAHGLSVNLHCCAENHHVMSSFGDASLLCEHCHGHHHEHLTAEGFEEHLKVMHFGEKCCCDDYETEIGFTDDYTFSTEKQLISCVASMPLAYRFQSSLDERPILDFRSFVFEKIPYLLTGRLRTIFFSHLKLNPLVF